MVVGTHSELWVESFLPSNSWLKGMDEIEVRRMFEKARDYVGDDVFSPYDFDQVGEREFLEQYLWTIFSSGFRWATLSKHFDGIASAFHDFDLDKIAAMDGIDAGVLPIRHQRKADAFLAGCRMVHEEGWDSLKERIRQRGRHVIAEFPYMGPKLQQHMAMVLGIEDTEKADTWLTRCAEACNSRSVDEMVTYLSTHYGLRRQQVDDYLWRYCTDHQDLP